MNKAVQSGFEIQRSRHQKSKTGVSVAPQEGFLSSKNFKKKHTNPILFCLLPGIKAITSEIGFILFRRHLDTDVVKRIATKDSFPQFK